MTGRGLEQTNTPMMHLMHSQTAKTVILAMGLAMGLAMAGCSPSESTTPVATAQVTLSRAKLALGAPVEITFRFEVSESAPAVTGDYRVLVHFLDADDELMWTDDHDPPKAPSTWKPGDTIEYTRTVFIPIYPYIGPASVHIGLYSPTDQRRLSLIGDDAGQQTYRVATLELLPQSENVFLVYEDGWHPAEIAEDNALVEWQWTSADAVVAFRNPGRDGELFLDLDGRPDRFERPQTVTITAGDATLDEFSVATRERILRRIPMAVSQFGPDEMIRVHIVADQTFVPAQLPDGNTADARELGVRVFHAFLDPH